MLASMKPRGGAVDMPAPTANVGNMALAHCNTSHGRVCTEKILNHIFWPWPHVKHPKGISKIHLSSCIVNKNDKNQSSESQWENRTSESNLNMWEPGTETWVSQTSECHRSDEQSSKSKPGHDRGRLWHWTTGLDWNCNRIMNHCKRVNSVTLPACILINTTTLLRSRPGKMNRVISYNYTDKVISLLSHGTNQRLSDSTQWYWSVFYFVSHRIETIK